MNAPGFRTIAANPSPAAACDPVDELALVVRLAARHLGAPLGGVALHAAVDLVQRRVAVDAGLARAEEIQVGAVQDEDAVARGSRVSLEGEDIPVPSLRANTHDRTAAADRIPDAQRGAGSQSPGVPWSPVLDSLQMPSRKLLGQILLEAAS